jgi:hypothetical protein
MQLYKIYNVNLYVVYYLMYVIKLGFSTKKCSFFCFFRQAVMLKLSRKNEKAVKVRYETVSKNFGKS